MTALLDPEEVADELDVAFIVDEAEDDTVPFTVPGVGVAASEMLETSGIVVDTLLAELVMAPARFAKPTAGGLYRYTEYTFFNAVSPTIHCTGELDGRAWMKAAPVHMVLSDEPDG